MMRLDRLNLRTPAKKLRLINPKSYFRRTVSISVAETDFLLFRCTFDIQQPQPFTKLSVFQQCRKHASVPQCPLTLRNLGRPDIWCERAHRAQPLLQRQTTKCAILLRRVLERTVDVVIAEKPDLLAFTTSAR